LPVDHYENFPVASWLVPGPLREPIEAIYGFARGADDVADEGTASDAERLAGLKRYGACLDAIERGEHPRGIRATRHCDPRTSVARATLPRPPRCLLAGRDDEALCRLRGGARLLPALRQPGGPPAAAPLPHDDPQSLEESDAICSSLQLINFWQDVAIDWQNGRVYIPAEDLDRFHVTEDDIANARASERWSKLMAFECARSRSFMLSGAPLGRRLRGRVGLEIRATVQGGLRILDRIDAAQGDVFRKRPVLKAWDWVAIAARAI
jgi:squalene synthase HpnC